MNVFIVQKLLCFLYIDLTRQLKAERSADYHKFEVGSLFVYESNSPIPRCAKFSTHDIPEDLLNGLYIIGDKNRNDLFEACWRQNCQSNVNLPSFAEVHLQVYVPAINECKQILVSLEQRTMMLEDVEKYFWKFDENELQQKLLRLCSGIRECYPTDRSISDGRNWIHLAVSDIQIYKKISGYMKTAQVVLDLKNAMNWKGDFTAVDTLAQQVRMSYHAKYKITYC